MELTPQQEVFAHAEGRKGGRPHVRPPPLDPPLILALDVKLQFHYNDRILSSYGGEIDGTHSLTVGIEIEFMNITK